MITSRLQNESVRVLQSVGIILSTELSQARFLAEKIVRTVWQNTTEKNMVNLKKLSDFISWSVSHKYTLVA